LIHENADKSFHIVKCLPGQIQKLSHDARVQLFDSIDVVVHTKRQNIVETILSNAIAHHIAHVYDINRYNVPATQNRTFTHQLELERRDVFSINQNLILDDLLLEKYWGKSKEKHVVEYDFALHLSPNDLLAYIDCHTDVILPDQVIKLDTFEEKIQMVSNIDEVFEWIEELKMEQNL
jgi:hypothetical protein